MLLFIAALQNIPVEVDEAAMIDGANTWQRFFQVTLPQLRPTLFTVLTLGLIGTWQVFDQIFVGTQGGPARRPSRPPTCPTPAPSATRTGGRARRSRSSCSGSSSS